MGRGYVTKCPKCGYEDYFHLGIGMAFSLQVRGIEKSILNGEYGDEALKQFDVLLESLGEGRFNYWFTNLKNVLFTCKKCKSVKVKPFFTIGNFYPSYKCEICNEVMHRVNPGTIRKHRCPNCGEIGLFDRDIEILWD